MTRPAPRNPLIAIIGATGTGKSELAVSLSQRYNGEVINGDAMQLYKGLPVITNKITTEERKGIPHHLLGCIGIDEPTWVVGTFVQKALGVVEEIRSRGKLPILVGGTHYYTQSLLFHDTLSQSQPGRDEAGSEEDVEFLDKVEDKFPILEESTELLIERLREVDPIMADRWHPNDRRKIQRSLQIYLQSGRKASDVYAEQRESKLRTLDSNGEQADMRFPALIFWIHAEADTLRDRLDGRVDKMLQRGLLQEVSTLESLAQAASASGLPVDETRGIWVSIGFKEFTKYTAALAARTHNDDDLARLKTEAVEKTKIATRQYAKRQVRWIRIKLINALVSANAGDSLYLLDGTDVSQFPKQVLQPALELTGLFLSGTPMPLPSSLSGAAAEQLVPKQDHDLAAAPQKWIREHCELCNVTSVTEKQWGQHTRSRTHRRLVSKGRKQEEANTEASTPRSDDAG